jgi:arylsulfatase A
MRFPTASFVPRLVAALAVVWFVTAGPIVPSKSDEPRRPNFVVILADDLGWSDLGCYGADLHETPSLDRLAREGMRFTQAYAAPVCSPTRASLMTGKHYARLHVTIWLEASQNPPQDRPLIPPVSVANLPHGEVTIARRLQAAGYLTALVGKWHLGDAAHYPETHGFDTNIGGTFWGAPHSYFFPYRGARSAGGEFRYVPHLEGGIAGEYLTDRLTDEAIRVIDSAGDRPFFVYLAHHAVHTPIEAKSDLASHFESRITDAGRHKNAKYAAMVASLDQSVGRVMDHLTAKGLADNTVLIFLSDNGGYLGQYDGQACTNNAPLRSGKGSVYEGGLRIPLIVRWPGVTTPGGTSEEPVHCMDLHATIAQAATLPSQTAAGLDGLSLVPLLEGSAISLPREALFAHYPHYYPTTTPASAVRARDWKLIEYYEDGRQELYNLRDDPGEQHDLSQQHAHMTATLSTKLHAWLREVAAQLPSPRKTPAR